MANAFDAWADQFRGLNLVAILRESIRETLPELEDKQTEQLSLGLLSTGELITPDLRSDAYAAQKKARGGKAPKFTPDLKDTNDFYTSIMARIEGNFIRITSNDPKADDLEDKYSDDIYGLSDKFQGEYNIQELLPVFLFNVRKRLGV